MSYFDDCMTLEELKTRYKEWVIKLHPDRNPGDADAERKFKEMQAEYECREAELKGDYTKSRKRRQQTERERKEREEQERRERERREVEMAVNEARENRTKSHNDIRIRMYLYAQCIQHEREWEAESLNSLLSEAAGHGVTEECVVNVDWIFEMTDEELLHRTFNDIMEHDYQMNIPLGGWKVLQGADPSAGRTKGKRVAKVVMFRSPSYVILGNPMGDRMCREYYVVAGRWETMFSTQLDTIRAKIAFEAAEKQRREEERRAKMLAEQQPIIEEWKGRLIEVSRSLSRKEQETVALENLRIMLKASFSGTRFTVSKMKGCDMASVRWEDGPTMQEVDEVMNLFCPYYNYGDDTPWMQKFGSVYVMDKERKMSTIAKAKILQQLGQVSMAFRDTLVMDDVTVSDFDWMMLHVMVGVDVSKTDHKQQCRYDTHPDGRRTTKPSWAIRFVFDHTSFKKPKKGGRKSSEKK